MKIIQRFLGLLLIVIICSHTKTFAQSLPDSTIKKIDKLFQMWNTTYSPGCTIGIIRNDSLIFAKGYGLANLEYAIPNKPETPFHMASISKQFTAYSIVLLARQGKLNLDDDVRKWLPWFPDLKEKITIRHLLNHTSGIRDQWQLLAIAGTRLDDVITQDQVIKILSKQEALNFKPGEKYTYSNSGFSMLAEIVKAASGKSLRQFTESNIFKPLGMTNTHFHDDYTEIERNRSYSYNRKDITHFTNAVLSYSVSGATSLFTNINDMSKWVMNFYSNKVGDQRDIDTLTLNGLLNNGKQLPYAMGIINSTWKGWRQYSHSGADAGYRTYISVFPDLKMGFLVFSNLSEINTAAKANEMAAIFINDSTATSKVPVSIAKDSNAAILKDTLQIKKFAGDYISEEGVQFSFDIKRNKLYYHNNMVVDFLLQKSKDSFSIPQVPGSSVVFGMYKKDTTVDINIADQSYHLVKFINDTAQSIEFLKKYEGIYYSRELDCKYGIVLKDRHLVLTNAKYNDAKLTLIGKDHLTTFSWWMNHLVIKRDRKNNIIGFEVNSGRIMHLLFNKIE